MRLAPTSLLLLATACATLSARTPDERWQLDRLYLGRAIGDTGLVSDSAWTAFAREVVTPRFEGFTSWRAEGAWRTTREPTIVLEILHPATDSTDALVRAIADEYKRRFRQEAVLRVTSVVRATF